MAGIFARVRQRFKNLCVETEPRKAAKDPNSTDTDREIAKLDSVYFREDALKRVESCSQIAQSIWRGLTIVNGGAIVALFTLIGDLIGVEGSRALWLAFFCFSAGLFLALVSNIAGYVTQGKYLKASAESAWNTHEQIHGRITRWDNEATYDQGDTYEWIALTSALLSLLGFLAGSGFALSAGLLNQ